MSIIAKDCESSGLSHHHSDRPFFLSTCDEQGNQCWWEADVDPLTRTVLWSEDDLREYEHYCNQHDQWAYTNAKFDLHMERSVGVVHPANVWDRVQDTNVAGHVIASSQPHDLTYMVKEYLGWDIKPFEDALAEAVKECRRMVQQVRLRVNRRNSQPLPTRLTKLVSRKRNPTPAQIKAALLEKEWDKLHAPLARWKICEEDMEGSPSATGKDVWRGDYWLPRAVAKHFNYKQGHPNYHFWTVLQEYANTDTAATLALWKQQELILKDRKHWVYYQERMKMAPILHGMEDRGVTVSQCELDRMTEDYTERSDSLGCQCVKIAARYKVDDGSGNKRPYQLVLPDGSVNDSLRVFMLDVLRLPHIHNPKAKTESPTLNKDALDHYQQTLDVGSIQHTFVDSLLDKRQIDTALSFMQSYRKFGRVIPTQDGYWVLNPSYKITGTTTTRLSSYGPNAQQISKKSKYNLRRCFGPAEGREWWSLDAKNIELRLPAYECGEQDLIDLFEKDTEPPYYGSEHLLNFHTVYPDVWEGELGKVCNDPHCCNGMVVDITRVGPHCKHTFASTWYRRCKNGGFAVGYGAIDRPGGIGTADRSFGRPGSHARLKQRFSKKESLNQHWIKFAEKHGYVETMPDRTVDPHRGYPLQCSRSPWGSIIPTVPLNYHVQGTAGDWMRKAMVRSECQLQEWRRASTPFIGYIILTVHDELVFDFPRRANPIKNPKGSNLWRIRIIQKLMESGGQDLVPSVPTKVSLEYHEKNWAEGESVV